jgi:hypothetical protein
MHKFETFRRATDLPKAQPYITIQRRGLISLNSAAYRALGAPAAVELLFNAEERIVGLRPVDPHASHCAVVRSPTRSAHPPYLISATAFTRYYEIDTTTAVRRVAYSRDDMLCIDLDSTAVPDAGAEFDAVESDDGDAEASTSKG